MSDSDEMSAVPSLMDQIEDSAAISALPVDLAVKDIHRRLREGNRRHARLKTADEEMAARLAALENMMIPRLTPARIGKIIGWVAAALIVVGGWLVTLDRMASRSDLRELEKTIHDIEVSIAKLTASKGVTP